MLFVNKHSSSPHGAANEGPESPAAALRDKGSCFSACFICRPTFIRCLSINFDSNLSRDSIEMWDRVLNESSCFHSTYAMIFKLTESVSSSAVPGHKSDIRGHRVTRAPTRQAREDATTREWQGGWGGQGVILRKNEQIKSDIDVQYLPPPPPLKTRNDAQTNECH
jgi:hypothetical protein